MLLQLELPRKSCSHISTNIITDKPEWAECTIILIVVDMLTKMEHFMPIRTKNSLEVAKAYLHDVLKYSDAQDHMVSDRDCTVTGQ